MTMAVGTKPCRICGALDRNARGNCLPCVKRRNREFRNTPAGRAYLAVKHRAPATKEQNFWYKIRVKYNLSREEYECILRHQDGKCSACGDEMRPVCVDHCHETGEVRGFLCRACNAAEGHLKSSPERCERLAAYLRRTCPMQRVACIHEDDGQECGRCAFGGKKKTG